ncbi:MAG: hypothetical protein KF850_02050 [Labilithrix sp.]|nr:hypothetical protein [Labilithrix sp.]
MILRNLTVPAIALAALFASACGDEPLRGTEGQLGTLRFEYTTADACAGCSLEREVLAGSLLDIDVHGVHPRVTFRVRSTAPDVAEFELSSRCRFIGHAGCRDGIAVSTKSAGDADLEVYDDWTGTVFDRITVKVRDAASLEPSVRVTHGGDASELARGLDGVFQLSVDSDVEIRATARSSSGAELIATSAAIQGAYEDEQVVGPAAGHADHAAAEYARAKRPGTTRVALLGGGAREDLVFHVVE